MTSTEDVARMAAAAANAIAHTRYCWLATSGVAGAANARPMGRLPRAEGDDSWLVRFITDDRSHKVAELGRDGEVGLVIHQEAADAYLWLHGPAAIRHDATSDARLWREPYGAYFPGEGERRHAAFLEIAIRRMDLWMRGVTPEPFGLRPTRLERGEDGCWRETVSP